MAKADKLSGRRSVFKFRLNLGLRERGSPLSRRPVSCWREILKLLDGQINYLLTEIFN
jgi:hypothetical protein